MSGDVTVSTFELFQMIPDAEAARLYLEARRWHGEPACPLCGAYEHITARASACYYRCRDCGGEFTVRTGTIFERSHVPLNKWVCHVPVGHGPQGCFSFRVGVTQKTAWFMLGRLPCGGDWLAQWDRRGGRDVHGKERNKHANKKLHAGRGPVGKQPLGLRERGGKSIATPIAGTDGATLRAAIERHVKPGSTVYTDEHGGYNAPCYSRGTVNHGAGEYVGAGTPTSTRPSRCGPCSSAASTALGIRSA